MIAVESPTDNFVSSLSHSSIQKSAVKVDLKVGAIELGVCEEPVLDVG
mgnify:CR=1 FL=1